MRYIAPLLTALMLPLLTGCGDSDMEERDRAAQFTTSTKPAPNPQRESLESLVRTDRNAAPTSLHHSPKYELYSTYNGEDIRQVTGVSGRCLLLCFTAPWCSHSIKMRQSLQQLAKKEKGNVQVVEINADAYPKLAQDYGLTKVPTTVFYTEGIKLRSIEGAYTPDSLRRFLHSLLSQQDDSNDVK